MGDRLQDWAAFPQGLDVCLVTSLRRAPVNFHPVLRLPSRWVELSLKEVREENCEV